MEGAGRFSIDFRAFRNARGTLYVSDGPVQGMVQSRNRIMSPCEGGWVLCNN